MKKYLFIAAAAAFAACTNDTLIEPNRVPETQEIGIGFGTSMNNMTRAENSTGDHGAELENYHKTMRIWGYKNVKNNPGTATTTTYKSTPVFDATSSSDLYAKSIATWDNSNPEPFTAADDWVYSPVRYWDKTATNYDFHAAAPDKDFAATPAVIDWKWNQAMADASKTWDAAAADGKGAGYFTLGDASHLFKLTGESLPINKEVSGQTNDVFGKGTNKDVDLMIADDVLNENPALHTATANSHVDFHFNHILSRLNIGVKIGTGITVTTDASSSKASKVVEGEVLLKAVEVYNVVMDGYFNENLAVAGTSGITSDELKAGTNLRWTLGTTKSGVSSNPVIGFPNKEVTGNEDNDGNNGQLNLSMEFGYNATWTYTKDLPKMVFQGLMIPQVAGYEDIAVDGSNITSSTTEPYIKIVYTLDGEEYTSYYNLAAAFSNTSSAYTTTDGCNIIKNGGEYVLVQVTPASTTGGTPTITYYGATGTYPALTKGNEISDVYFVNAAGDKWWNSSWEELTSAPTNGTSIQVNSSNGLDYVLRSEVGGECDITFCEGWQNNLWITINPTAILFDAEVYKWADKYSSASPYLTVE